MLLEFELQSELELGFELGARVWIRCEIIFYIRVCLRVELIKWIKFGITGRVRV